jgi:hypothetical protein
MENLGVVRRENLIGNGCSGFGQRSGRAAGCASAWSVCVGLEDDLSRNPVYPGSAGQLGEYGEAHCHPKGGHER